MVPVLKLAVLCVCVCVCVCVCLQVCSAGVHVECLGMFYSGTTGGDDCNPSLSEEGF